jgi:hypothetical protein
MDQAQLRAVKQQLEPSLMQEISQLADNGGSVGSETEGNGRTNFFQPMRSISRVTSAIDGMAGGLKSKLRPREESVNAIRLAERKGKYAKPLASITHAPPSDEDQRQRSSSVVSI